LTFFYSSTIKKAKNVIINVNVYNLPIDQHFSKHM